MKKLYKMFKVFGTAMAISLLIGACKSPPAEKHVAIPEQYVRLMKSMKDKGFQKIWGKPEEIKQYDKIVIATKISPTQLKKSWWGKQNAVRLVSSEKDDLKFLAEYARKSFIEAFNRDSTHFTLVDKPGPKTLALEFVIVQIVPNKPVLGVISNLGALTPIGLLIAPLKLSIKSASPDAGGAIAMETIIRDSVTGKILGVVADRSKGKVAYFNTKEFTPYGNIKDIIDRWTSNFVTALDQIKRGEKVNIPDDAGWGVID